MKMDIIRWLKSVFIRLRRMPRTRGFGVQSPSAYRFLRDVISPRGRYAVAEGLPEGGSTEGKGRLKLLNFYARVAGFTQAKRWFVSERLASDGLKAYVCAGCQAAEVSSVLDDSGVYVVDAADVQLVNEILTRASASSLLIIEGIHHSAGTLRKWRQVVADRRTGVCFDMYEAGVAGFDLKKFKTSYQVNL